MSDETTEAPDGADRPDVSIAVTVRGGTTTEVIQRAARLVEVFDAEVTDYQGGLLATVATTFDSLEELEEHLATVYAADEEGE